MKSFNEIIIANIEKRLPENTRVVKYLMDTLIIGKEPAYRRIRNEVPFTFSEVAAIATDLGFSIDDIVGQQQNESNIVQFSISVVPDANAYKVFSNYLERTTNIAKMLYESKVQEAMMMLNRIPWGYLPFKLMFKFDYCRLLLGYNQLPLGATFADVQIPPEFLEGQQKLAYYSSHLSKACIVTDKNVLDKTIAEVKYYYEIHFISDEDLKLIQKELFDFLESMMIVNQKGVNESSGMEHICYVSEFSIDNNVIHYEYDGETIDQFWIYFENPIIIKSNPLISTLQKRQIQGRIKYSTLLSSSNHRMLTDIYWKMRKSIKNMIKE